MNCKNCQTKLEGEKKFCTKCGAKSINHRLNFKTVTQEFFATFISWDNKFLKTFIHLFTKPQLVANGYLDGVRKKYMQPFAYMILALTIYGIYMIFIKDQMLEQISEMNFDAFSNKGSNPKKDAFMQEFMKKWIGYVTRYFNIFTLLMIPLLAFINKIIFKKRNFIEHNVTLYYAYATYLLLAALIGVLALIFGIHYRLIYMIIMPLMIGYHIYFYKKMFKLDIAETILKTLLFWLLMAAFYVFVSIVGGLIFFLLLYFKIISITSLQ